MLTFILIGLVLAVAAVLILVATRPDTFRVQRTASIMASAAKIFPLIADLRRHEQWSPYYRKDPAMKGAYSGPESGPGAAFDFDGDKNVGAGVCPAQTAGRRTRL